MLTDKQLRAKFVFLTLALAQKQLQGATRQEVEARIKDITDQKVHQPADEWYLRGIGTVIAGIVQKAHNLIYNYELKDYRERKAGTAQEPAGL